MHEPIWVGAERPAVRDAIRAKLPFPADDLLVRGYQNANGAFAQLYMVHSRAGEDRKHHPERQETRRSALYGFTD